MFESIVKFIKGIFHRLLVLSGAVLLTLTFFLVLPLIQTISRPPSADMMVQSIDVANVPPPPPPPEEEEPDEEPEPEPEQPELEEQTELLDLEQLQLALNPGYGDGLAGDFAIDIGKSAAAGGDNDAIFSLSDLDQRPRAIYQIGPTMTPQLRKRTPATVYIIFLVDEEGRVQDPQVQQTTDPMFDQPALTAVKKWKFEPGKRSGKPVRFRMRVPITFPKSQ